MVKKTYTILKNNIKKIYLPSIDGGLWRDNKGKLIPWTTPPEIGYKVFNTNELFELDYYMWDGNMWVRTTNGEDKSLIIDLSTNFYDLGVLSYFDGNILSENIFNISYSGFINNNNINIFFNVDQHFLSNIIDIVIDWGDGTISNNVNIIGIGHTYIQQGNYMVSIVVKTNYGEYFYYKQIPVPQLQPDPILFESFSLSNGINVEYNEEFEQNTYSGGTNLTFFGIGQSRLEELKEYGTNNYIGATTGVTDGLSWTGYTIDNLYYQDFEDGITKITGNTGNYTVEQIINRMMTRNEHFLGFIEEPIVESDIFIDRGKQGVMEKNLRLCEIDSMGELTVYGNGHFKIKKQ